MVLVLLAHFALVSHASAVDEGMHAVLLLGYTGLDLFFVLSGFLITGVLLDARDSPDRVRNFYVRRALRVIPLYYGVVIALLVVVPLLRPEGTPALDALRRNQWWYWLHGTNFIWKRAGATPYNTGHFWSLAVEEQYYLLWPFVVFALSPKRLLRVCAACVAGALVARIVTIATGHAPWVGSFVWTRMDTLAAGGALAVLARRPAGLAPYRSVLTWVGVSAGAFAVVSFFLGQRWTVFDTLHLTLGYSAVAISFAAFVGAASAGWMDRVVARPVFRFFGRYSYGMYIFHLPMMLKFAPVYALIDRVPLVAGTIVLRQLVFFAIATPITAAAGVASWHLYERHFLALKRYFPAVESRGGATKRESGSATLTEMVSNTSS